MIEPHIFFTQIVPGYFFYSHFILIYDSSGIWKDMNLCHSKCRMNLYSVFILLLLSLI